MIGRVLSGRYVIQEVVGTGGMAVVYRAWDKKNNREVAIKVLRPEYEQDQEFVRRFSREAEAAAKMSHENIVNLLDVGKDENMRYIVMEFVAGVTLKEMIRREGRIPTDTAVRMAIRILAAVDHAHRNGIVHRDIKPQNILVDEQGNVKVADFGIARLKAQQTTRIDDGQNSALGSVHYFSPEQASGEVADEKSDLYSVGVVIYEMLTGEVPFDGDTAVSVALKHVSEEPRSMRSINPAISRGLDEVVMRALAKESFRRYQTAAEMAGDLRHALLRPRGGFVHYPLSREEQEKVREQQRRRAAKRKKRLRFTTRIASAFVGLAVIGMALWYFLAVHDVIEVPNALGQTEQAAYEILSDFTVEKLEEYSEDYQQGTVIGQSPEPGNNKKRGSTVTITVSKGSQWIYLEDFTNCTLEEAAAQLVSLGMPVENIGVRYVLSEVETGCVCGQEPQSGWITREDSVTFEVSGETVVVPTFTGLELEGAKALMQAEGIRLGQVTEGYSADAAAGTVIAQSVAPGATIMAGDSIDLTISQSVETTYYSVSYYTLVVPLDNLPVRLEMTTPSGQVLTVYEAVLSKGTHLLELTSQESGEHMVREYLDGVLMSENSVLFE